ncbi:MAG: substrate-binding domain-containing protein [Bacteroidales bacterium]|nr:substrate-binding domain-containing protein [Bacteroidales bacterium]
MRTIKTIVILLIGLFILLDIQAQDSLQIGLSIGDLFADRWYKDHQYIVESANKMGAAVKTVYGNGEADKQETETLKLLDAEIDILIIIPADGDKCGTIVKKAKEKSVPIISYDRIIRNEIIDYYISFDNVKVGELQAQYAYERAPKGNYVLIGGPVKDNNALLFTKGQKNVLKQAVEKGDINIIYDQHLVEWNSMEAFMALQNLTDYSGKIAAIIASSDLLSSGALMAIDIEGVDKGTIITGQDASLDACVNIVAGKQTMTIYKPINKLAKEAVQLAVKVAKNEKVENASQVVNNKLMDVPSVLLEPMVVDVNNLRETVIADGYHKEEDVFNK